MTALGAEERRDTRAAGGAMAARPAEPPPSAALAAGGARTAAKSCKVRRLHGRRKQPAVRVMGDPPVMACRTTKGEQELRCKSYTRIYTRIFTLQQLHYKTCTTSGAPRAEQAIRRPRRLAAAATERLGYRKDSDIGKTRISERLGYRKDSNTGTTRIPERLGYRNDSDTGTTRIPERLGYRKDSDIGTRHAAKRLGTPASLMPIRLHVATRTAERSRRLGGDTRSIPHPP